MTAGLSSWFQLKVHKLLSLNHDIAFPSSILTKADDEAVYSDRNLWLELGGIGYEHPPVAALADSNPEHPNCLSPTCSMAFTLTEPGSEQAVIMHLEGYNHARPVNAA